MKEGKEEAIPEIQGLQVLQMLPLDLEIHIGLSGQEVMKWETSPIDQE